MLRDSTGKTIGSVAVNRDITARKHAESALRQNEAYLRAVVTGTPSILFALDTDGIFTMLEGKSLEAADLEPGSLVGQSAFDPSHHFIPHMKDHFQVALTGQEVASIEQINKIIFDVRYSPLSAEDGEVIGVIGVAADITEHERLRQEQLENEKLQFALKKEQELNEFRMQFMSLVSHDFRTPLTVIQTSASMMQTYRDRLTAAQIDKRVEQISTQILRLTEMLDAVMLVMRGQSGRLEFNPAATNLREFCEDVAATMRTTTGDNQNLTLRAKGDINAVQVDQELLRHILLNLISNAIKYSPDGGTITVTVVREESDIVIRVSDQGIGIPPEDQKRLFQPYQRASNTGSIKGTGLGLSIVKLCAEAHTGNVSVASQPGGGSTFTVVLPDAVVPQKKPG
jgi:PAS domain S-box-containing protein